MNYLFFDIASHTATFACIDGDQVKSFLQKDERIGDQELIPCIKECLEQAGWAYGDLEQIACVIGPGGFTTLRIAVAGANTLAHELKIPSAGVHLSDVYFARASVDSPSSGSGQAAQDDTLFWVHSTKRDQLFLRSTSHAEPHVIAPEELPDGIRYCGELIDDHQKIADEKNMKQETLVSLKDVLPKIVSSVGCEQKILLPWYGRGI